MNATNTIMCSSIEIYNAMREGAKNGFNRSTDDCNRYIKALEQCYNNMLDVIGEGKEREQVIAHTHGMWQQAIMPLSLAMIHHHKAGVECEAHARVFLSLTPSQVFDIPLAHWERLKAKAKA